MMKYGLARHGEIATAGELIKALSEYHENTPLDGMRAVQSWQCEDSGEISLEVEDDD